MVCDCGVIIKTDVIRVTTESCLFFVWPTYCILQLEQVMRLLQLMVWQLILTLDFSVWLVVLQIKVPLVLSNGQYL